LPVDGAPDDIFGVDGVVVDVVLYVVVEAVFNAFEDLSGLYFPLLVEGDILVVSLCVEEGLIKVLVSVLLDDDGVAFGGEEQDLWGLFDEGEFGQDRLEGAVGEVELVELVVGVADWVAGEVPR
jgi:hypothetical protein